MLTFSIYLLSTYYLPIISYYIHTYIHIYIYTYIHTYRFGQTNAASQVIRRGDGCCTWIEPELARDIAGYSRNDANFAFPFCGDMLTNNNDQNGRGGGWRQKCCSVSVSGT